MEGLILQIPLRLIRETIDATGPQGEVLDAFGQPWAVLYRKATAANELSERLVVAGFGPEDELAKIAMEAWLEEHYRSIDVTAVLHNGRPVKFNLRVKARIG